jgi:DNA-directed RNA polymerase subunit RPC12/RpoP
MATATYKCPNCGGPLHFEPEIQKLKCSYCLSVFTHMEVKDLGQEGQRQETAEGQGAPREDEGRDNGGAEEGAHLLGYICDSCGAEVVTEETTTATFCYYCHNPVILTDRLTGSFRPDRVIPFTYDREKAVESFLGWAKGKKYVPRGFYSESQLEKITGVYLPYWMADVEADVNYAGKGINRRVYRVGNTEYTEVQEFEIQRQGKVDVANIHEVAMRKIDRGLLDSISPYDDTKAMAFQTTYLSGFLAEKYDIGRDEVRPVITQRAEDYAANLVQETIRGFGSVELHDRQLDVSITDWYYTLLPAWILTYFYQGKTYIYAVNGQTGKSYGELPVDNRKLGTTSAAIGAAIFIAALVGGLFLW